MRLTNNSKTGHFFTSFNSIGAYTTITPVTCRLMDSLSANEFYASAERIRQAAQALVATDCRLGPACAFNHKALVHHECIVGSGVHFEPGTTTCGCVMIGDNVTIESSAVVMPRLTIGPYAMIGAGAVVTKDVPDEVVDLGTPGKKRPD